MQLTRRSAMLGLACLAAGAASAQPQAGRDYVAVTPPQPTNDASRVVVTEFFSYGCPHCASFSPALTRWVGALPSDVAFERVAVVLGREPWRGPAKLFYALQSIGKVDALDAAIFNAIHREQKDLFTDAAIIDWVEDQGVDRAQFTAAFNSFGMRSFVARGDQVATAHRVSGVPTLVVDGRYMLEVRDDGVFIGQLAVADQLIAMARAARAA
jgi:protein dithiol oxidoreductase (disulfide-forming)